MHKNTCKSAANEYLSDLLYDKTKHSNQEKRQYACMVAQEIRRSKLLQELSHTLCQLEISFITATASPERRQPKYQPLFRRYPGDHLFHSVSPQEKQVGELLTTQSARPICASDKHALQGLWKVSAEIPAGSL